jgi:RimJ/RimL family protein N-acetyltransferase
MGLDWLSAEPVTIDGDGLVLREWAPSDVPALVTLYNTPEMDRRTPVPFPFTTDVARSYVENADKWRGDASLLQLAITEDGGAAVGEILVAPTGENGTVELAYAVNQRNAGRGLARRAVHAEIGYLTGKGVDRARLLIADDNLASRRVAIAAGFVRIDRPLLVRRRKGMVLELATWDRPIPTPTADPPTADPPTA